MDVKEAVKKSLQHISDLFDSEELSNIGLEEVEYSDAKDEWVVTIGFSRPWDYQKSTMAIALGQNITPKRSYKVVRIDAISGNVVSVKNHEAQK